jgi:hypothetical protein
VKGIPREFAVALDREIYGVLTTLQALATSPNLQSGDYTGFYKQVVEVSRLQNINISLRTFTGHAILTTRAPFGEDVAVPKNLAEADQRVLRSGAPAVTDIFTSTIAGKPVFQIMAVPLHVAGAPALVLGASNRCRLSGRSHQERAPAAGMDRIFCLIRHTGSYLTKLLLLQWLADLRRGLRLFN